MSGWRPRFATGGFMTSDDRGDDAEGGCLTVEWFGVIVEVAVARRAKPVHRCIVCDAESTATTPIGVEVAPGSTVPAAMCRSCRAVFRELGL